MQAPKYFMLLGWAAGKVATIRDFRHAAYVDRRRRISDLTAGFSTAQPVARHP